MPYRKPEVMVLGNALELIQSIKKQGSELASPQDQRDAGDSDIVS